MREYNYIICNYPRGPHVATATWPCAVAGHSDAQG